jgi:hypothetical protein
MSSALAALLAASATQREASWRVAVGTSVAGGAAAAAAEAANQAQSAANAARASQGGRFLLRMATRKGKPIPAIMKVSHQALHACMGPLLLVEATCCWGCQGP